MKNKGDFQQGINRTFCHHALMPMRHPELDSGSLNSEIWEKYINAFLKQNSVLNLISKNDEKFLWEKHIFDSLAIERFFEKYFNNGKLKVESGKLINNNDKDLSPYRPIALSSDNNHSTIQLFNRSTNNNFQFSTFNFQLLDIGTGGGFPAVPIAIMYPEIEVYALDSIRKKINAIENIKAELGLKNLHTICDRAENLIEAAKQLRSQAVKKSAPTLPSPMERVSEGQEGGNPSTFQPFNYSTDNNFQLSTFNFQFDIITSRAVAPLKVITEYAMPLLKEDGYFITYKSIKAQKEIKDARQVLKKHNAKVIDIIQYDLPLDENFTRNLVVIAKK